MNDANIESPAFRSLGPAMRFVLALATRRARERAALVQGASSPTTVLWDLAERHHPEEAWLAQSYLRGERSLAELERGAPREGLAPGVRPFAGSLSAPPAIAPAGLPPALARMALGA